MEKVLFEKARPVFLRGMSGEKNITAWFRAVFRAAAGEEWRLRITASSAYRVWLNGEFAGYGPARAAHGYYRMDELPLTPQYDTEENRLVIEVAGYNVGGYYWLDQPAFVQAELCCDGSPARYTAVGEGGFAARRMTERMQRTQRFSFQRPFTEVYCLDGAYASWQQHGGDGEPVEELPPRTVIPRGIPLPSYSLWPAREVTARGKLGYGNRPQRVFDDRSLTQISEICKGFPKKELTCCLSDEVQALSFAPSGSPCAFGEGAAVPADGYVLLDFGKNKSGFIRLELSCTASCTLYLLFDEVLCGGDIDFLRSGCCAAAKLELAAGEHTFESFEPYTLRYLKIAAKGGACTVRRAAVRRYETGVPLLTAPAIADEELACIYAAAEDTFRQNAVDILTDCPSRERAGWLCDTFFTARAEKALTGANRIEENFLENYRLPEAFAFLPAGMVPMRYPADDDERVFIPNWAMWLVLELRDYRDRGGSEKLIEAFRDRVYALLAYFRPFENEYGLLEKLDGWVFVEWSKANELVQDVSFPTNMLYAHMLRAAGELYGDAALTEKAVRVAAAVNDWSYDGRFYVDNAVRRDGVLQPTGERTEVCQYYAFFCGIASPDTRPWLWKTLLEDFGAGRKQHNAYPEIYFANAFIGNYLRMELLFSNGLYARLLEEIKAYFGGMARLTGTLWEFDAEVASCCHGFTSVLAYWIRHVLSGQKLFR